MQIGDELEGSLGRIGKPVLRDGDCNGPPSLLTTIRHLTLGDTRRHGAQTAERGRAKRICYVAKCSFLPSAQTTGVFRSSNVGSMLLRGVLELKHRQVFSPLVKLDFQPESCTRLSFHEGARLRAGRRLRPVWPWLPTRQSIGWPAS